MKAVESSGSSTWSREDNAAFENAIPDFLEETDDRWEKFAAVVPGKTPDEIKKHFEMLVEDLDKIESGLVPLPDYAPLEDSNVHASDEGGSAKRGGSSQGSRSKAELERRKGIAWTEEEHRLFLLGLEKYGKGDWRSISRNYVVTRTPTQVASHAQKYFIRLNSINKDRRRTSIHDIRSVGQGDSSAPQGPITGLNNTNNGAGAGAGDRRGSTKSTNQITSQPPALGPSMHVAPSIGQLVSGPAMGTPVNLQTQPHMAYGVHSPPGSGSLVPGVPMNIAPMAYHMRPKSTKAHR